MKDFVVDSVGQCFLCMSHVDTQSSAVTLFEALVTTPSSSPSHYSVQYLSRYLKMDRLKVFNDKNNIPSRLMSQVKRAKLKVILCRECGFLNQQFSVLFKQLEKTEMEIASCLNLIHGKLAAAKNKNATDGSQTLTDNPTMNGLIGKAEVANVLRTEAMQKCSLILSGLMPLVRIENLTLEKVTETQIKMKVNCRRASRNYTPDPVDSDEAAEKSAKPGIGSSPKIKMEYDSGDYDIISNDDADESHLPKQDLPDPVVNYPVNPVAVIGIKSEMVNVKVEGESRGRRHKQKVGGKRKIGTTNKASPTTLKVMRTGSSKKYKRKSSINPINGKIRCGLCAKEFASRGGFESHYDSIHFYIKYNCSTNGCSKVFRNKFSLYKHQQTDHMGTRYYCDVCNKSFTQKDNLRRHYITSRSCGKGKSIKPLKMHRCHICGKESNRAGNLRKHVKLVHTKYY